jgi:hypothetical protein
VDTDDVSYHVDLLKIDAEGNDNKVITGARRAIDATVSLFTFEGGKGISFSQEFLQELDEVRVVCVCISHSLVHTHTHNNPRTNTHSHSLAFSHRYMATPVIVPAGQVSSSGTAVACMANTWAAIRAKTRAISSVPIGGELLS